MYSELSTIKVKPEFIFSAVKPKNLIYDYLTLEVF